MSKFATETTQLSSLAASLRGSSKRFALHACMWPCGTRAGRQELDGVPDIPYATS